MAGVGRESALGRLVREGLSEEVTLYWDLKDEKEPGVMGRSVLYLRFHDGSEFGGLRNIKTRESGAEWAVCEVREAWWWKALYAVWILFPMRGSCPWKGRGDDHSFFHSVHIECLLWDRHCLWTRERSRHSLSLVFTDLSWPPHPPCGVGRVGGEREIVEEWGKE